MEKILKHRSKRIDNYGYDQQSTIHSNKSPPNKPNRSVVSYADVSAILQKHVRIAENSFDQLAKSYLARARRQTSTGELGASTSVDEAHESSPFLEISEWVDYMSTRSKKKKSFAFSSHCNGSISTGIFQKVETIKYDGRQGVNVPGHTFHVQLQSNVVTENNTKLSFNPNEIQFEDPQWSLEEYEEELKEHFTGGRLEQRARPLQYAEKATYLRPFMLRALEEIGCPRDALLRYFLDLHPGSAARQKHLAVANKEGFGPLSDKAKWSSVLSTLPDTSERTNCLAETFCEAFQKLTKFSAWYLVKDIGAKQSQESAQSLGKDAEMCRLCFRYCCTSHGEYRDDETRAVKRRKTVSGSSNDNYRININLHPRQAGIGSQDDTALQDRKPRQSYKFWKDTLKIYRSLDENLPVNYARGHFYPCNHDGSCKDNDCRCFRAGVNCEKFCGCQRSCSRRFRGCDCARRDIPCSQKGKCVCRMMDRECDPDLCESCGAVQVLDPPNSGQADRSLRCCSNVGIQRGIPKRMLIGSSPVSGFGLFMVERARKGDYLAEYKGELVSQSEAQRRQILHQYLREYLFELNRDQQIDSLYAGNKLRFINNSCKPENINCDPIPMFCNGVIRMGLFATRTLQPGDELFFNYGYTEEQMEDFKEPAKKQRTLSKSASHSRRKPNSTHTGTSAGLLGNRKSMTAAAPIARPSPLANRVIADSDDGFDDSILDSDVS